MFIKTKKITLNASLIIATLLAACTPNNTSTPTKYENGIFTINEGPFQNGTGTMSFYNEKDQTTQNDVFQTENNRPIGNIAQSIAFHEGKGYIVVNNAQKIEIVDAKTFKSTGVINGLNQPRYFVGVASNKAYVSQWGADGSSGNIAVVNLSNNTIIKNIATGKGSEQMLAAGAVNKLIYVCNSGGFANDTTLTVINPTTDQIVKQIKVGDNPNSIAIDKNGKIWVLCGGKNNFMNPSLSTAGQLIKIDPNTNTVEKIITFSSNQNHPNELTLSPNGLTLYYLDNFYGGKLFAQNTDANTLNTTPLINNKTFFTIGTHNRNGQDLIYAAGGTFAANGKAYRYKTDGTLVDSFAVGIIPTQFYFR